MAVARSCAMAILVCLTARCHISQQLQKYRPLSKCSLQSLKLPSDHIIWFSKKQVKFMSVGRKIYNLKRR